MHQVMLVEGGPRGERGNAAAMTHSVYHVLLLDMHAELVDGRERRPAAATRGLVAFFLGFDWQRRPLGAGLFECGACRTLLGDRSRSRRTFSWHLLDTALDTLRHHKRPCEHTCNTLYNCTNTFGCLCCRSKELSDIMKYFKIMVSIEHARKKNHAILLVIIKL